MPIRHPATRTDTDRPADNDGIDLVDPAKMTDLDAAAAVRIRVTGDPYGPIGGIGVADGELVARRVAGASAASVSWPTTDAASAAVLPSGLHPTTPPLIATTATASEAAQALARHVRAAHSASCEKGGPMELLLRKALSDALAIAHDLDQLAGFAAEGRGA